MTTETTKTPKTRVVRKARITKAEKEQQEANQALVEGPLFRASIAAATVVLPRGFVRLKVDGNDFVYLAKRTEERKQAPYFSLAHTDVGWLPMVIGSSESLTKSLRKMLPSGEDAIGHDLERFVSFVVLKLPTILAALGEPMAEEERVSYLAEMKEWNAEAVCCA